MSMMTNWLDNKLYPDTQANWDDILFKKRILKYLEHNSLSVLDLGAGAGIVKQMNFLGVAKKVCGIDPDPRVEKNPFLDEGKVAFGDSIPYEAHTFDLVFADNVLEHIENPEKVFSEVQRVLKPGGVFLVKTPNKWHYMPLIARMTPHWFHQFICRLRGRRAEDTFPTLYLVNTPEDIYRESKLVGFDVINVDLVENRPEYLRMFTLTYLIGWLYEKLVNSHPWLKRFRILLIAEMKKPLE